MDQSQRRVSAELEERVEQIFSALEQLRESADGRERRKIVDSIFRNVHSLKASASASGLDQLARVSHEFENLLHSLRIGRTKLDDNLLRLFDETAEALFSGLDPATSSPVERAEPPTPVNSEAKQRKERGSAELEILLNTFPSDIWQSLSEQERHRLRESAAEGANVYLVNTSFELARFDEEFQSLKEALSSRGEVISTAPTVDPDQSNSIDFRILYCREAGLEEIRNEFKSFSDVSISEVVESAVTNISPPVPTAGTIGSTEPTESENESSARSIRIALDDLDRIISSTHKLYRDTSRGLAQVSGILGNTQLSPPDMMSLNNSVNDSFLDLTAQLINLRMVPVERVLQRALRSGRRLAHASGKEIDFQVRGRDLRLDKSLCDAIADPVIHLVRNAVDHGVENGDERDSLGKKRRGLIRIEAESSQGQTRISVSDDGRGIQPTAVSNVARQMGLIGEQAELNVEQSVRMLFRSGFSTATEVSSISGRGVGLDVVEKAIEDLGGEIRVSSMAGLGSVFEMRLPVTFGLLQTVIVSSGDQFYLLDKKQVLTSEIQIRNDLAENFTRIDSELLPVHHLYKLLGKPRSDGAEAALVCELRNEDLDGSIYTERIALVVNGIVGTQKVLVRNIGSRGPRWFGVSGAAELRDGRVALLLDLTRLVKTTLSNP